MLIRRDRDSKRDRESSKTEMPKERKRDRKRERVKAMKNNNTRSVYVMVNFICQISMAMLSRYLVKHYSASSCESEFIYYHQNQPILSKVYYPPLRG